MNGDPNQTSTKLRLKAIDVIKNSKRPLASHEIQDWIRENDEELYKLISQKCSDYVRIILSVTQDSPIIKYKSLTPIQGVDKRLTFYGLMDKNYNKNEWAIIASRQSHNRRKPVIHTIKPREEIKMDDKKFSSNLPEVGGVHLTSKTEVMNINTLFEEIDLSNGNWMVGNWEDNFF